MTWADVIKLIISLVICIGTGGVGALFTTPAIPAWYKSLKKPQFTPPNSAFGPIWTILYILMGIAVFLVWRRGLNQDGVTAAFAVFWFQLVLNLLWSVVFFGFKSLWGGVVIITILWIAIVATIILFFPISAVAGGLRIPYIIWVSIATNLNIQVWRLNRQ